MNRRQFLKTAAAGDRIAHPAERRPRGQERPRQQAERRADRRLGPRPGALRLAGRRERGRAVRREREAVSGRPEAVPQGQDLRRLAQVPRSKRPRRRGLLHGRPHPRLHRQLGAEPRPARLLREAAGHQRRRSPRRAGELAEEEGQAGHAGRHAAARDAELQPRARADPRRRDRRADGGLRLGQPPDPPRRLPARARPAAGGLPLRSLARPVAGASLQPRLFLRRAGRELPVVEHVLGLRRRPDRRHGQPHHGPAVERRRRHVADLGGSEGREVQSRRYAGRVRVALRAPGQRLARPDPRELVPGRGRCRCRRSPTST